MAACIRAPRGQSTSIENIHHGKSSNNTSPSHKSIVQIYLDWGNHYLEKARSKRLLADLQSDLIDGVLLADLIEAVTSQKVPDIQRKPKTAGQMVENIRSCLTTVERLGVNLEGVSVKEIREGSLRSVLALFFALSKHKQQLKLQAESNRVKKHDAEMLSRLPTPYQSPMGHGHHQTSIPTPLSLRHNQTVHPVSSSPLKCPSTSSSRSTSPSHSFIPTPRGPARSSLNDKQLVQNSQRIAGGRPTQNSAVALSSPYSVPNKNNSMLDKFKLFNSKEKNKPVTNSAKRTSSSSGFSSARSERSDSSTSLCSENKLSNQVHERKETSQTDLNKVGGANNVVTKKQRTTIRVSGGGDSKVVRPNSRTTSIASSTASRPNSGQSIGSANQVAPSSPPVAVAASTDSKSSPRSVVKTSVKETEQNLTRNEELTQPVNPPPPPAPTKASDNRPATMKEPARIPGGGAAQTTTSNIPPKTGLTGLGIPKPTAVVKGYSKPTHPVAPMPPTPTPSEQLSIEKEKQPQMTKNHRLDAVLESSHERQNSIEEAEEALANLKPMPPLLPGYNKRAIAIAPRTIPFNRSRGYRPLDTYPRSNTERNFAECDYNSSPVASGYLSDGEILHSKINEESNDGYLSEGGTGLYQYAQDSRHKGGSGTLPRSDQSKSERSKQRHQAELREASRAIHEAHVELSNSENHSPKTRILNGTASGGVVRDGGGLSSSAQPHPVVYRVIGSRHIKKADSSQQTENSAFRQVSSSQWKGGNEAHLARQHDNRTELEPASSKNGREKRSQSSSNGVHRKQEKKHNGSREELDLDFCNGERSSKGSSSGSSCGSGGKKIRGSAQNFGYPNKKPMSNGSVNKDPRAAQVQGMPRTKVKVSGGTQTEYSGPQLSAGVRERLLMSSPKAVSRHIESGSLSDSNYAEITTSPYSAWLRHSGAYTASLPARTSAAGTMIDPADSIESLPAQLHHHRASLTHARYIGSPATAPRLSRSNSIRSTKSEKLYPSMFQRSEDVEPYYSIPYNIGVAGGHHQGSHHHHHSSQPTSPTPSQLSHGAPARLNYPISPISSSPSTQGMCRNSPYMGIMTKVGSKDDEVHGSAVSLVSTTSSLYSTAEEKQAHEVRKLRKELSEAQEKVHTLTNQLSTNAHVVSAFEQSLSNMTQRLQQLTTTAEKKDSELMELRQTIDLLRKQSVEAGLTSHNLSPSFSRRHTINSTPDNEGNISRQLSTDSVSSLNSLSSACSLSSPPVNHENEKKKKHGWLRSSFSKAFSRTKKSRNGGSGSSDVEDKVDGSAPSSPLLNQPHQMNGGGGGGSSGGSLRDERCSHSPIDDYKDSGPEVVEELRKQLREKDLVLTDIRLEALSSAHQLESLKDTVIKMRNEMVNLKQDNERLQRLVTSKSLTSSQSSLPRNDSLERRFSMNDAIQDCKYDLFAGDPDGKRVTLTVFMGCHGSYHRYVEDNAECTVASLSVSGKTKWEMLDAMIRRAFKDYLERIDPVGALGLAADSIYSYHIGEVVRYKDSKLPELLPCGYLVGDVSNISVCLKGALHSGSLDALAFDTLVPKSIIQRYVSLLTEYRRIILCGPSGTGKTHLANKLAEFLVIRAGKESTAESIATFNVEHKSSKELRQYLSNIAEQCETNAADLPSVIILDNLHQASSLTEVFNGFLKAKFHKCPFIIGTMNQATCSTTNLQLHHNFRWILCANHMEPVKGFLGRYLKRKFIESEARSGVRNPEMTRVTDWIPRAWLHLNQFLEAHSSSDVTIGPRLFLSCPMDSDGSQVWFTDLWNYSIVPYLLEAVREGLQMYGKRAAWQDPAQYVSLSYPWAGEAVHGGPDALIRLRPEDVGYDTHQSPPTQQPVKPQQQQSQPPPTESEPADPLLNMLMRLQEAANYSNNGPTKDEIDTESVDPIAVQPVL